MQDSGRLEDADINQIQNVCKQTGRHSCEHVKNVSEIGNEALIFVRSPRWKLFITTGHSLYLGYMVWCLGKQKCTV